LLAFRDANGDASKRGETRIVGVKVFAAPQPRSDYLDHLLLRPAMAVPVASATATFDLTDTQVEIVLDALHAYARYVTSDPEHGRAAMRVADTIRDSRASR
jgi:hypothetical protein